MATKINRLTDIAKEDMLKRHAAMSKDLTNPIIGANEFSVTLFQRDFLPYFCGQLPPTKDLLPAWANVAGDIKKYVVLIDDDGKAVTIVPPLSNSNMFNLLRPDRVNSPDPQTLEARLAAQKAVAPNLATNNLISGLVDRFKPVAPKEDEKIRQEWLKLFEYFGVAKPGEEQKQVAQPTISLSFDDDY